MELFFKQSFVKKKVYAVVSVISDLLFAVMATPGFFFVGCVAEVGRQAVVLSRMTCWSFGWSTWTITDFVCALSLCLFSIAWHCASRMPGSQQM
jgi:hypothetical protein